MMDPLEKFAQKEFLKLRKMKNNYREYVRFGRQERNNQHTIGLSMKKNKINGGKNKTMNRWLNKSLAINLASNNINREN